MKSAKNWGILALAVLLISRQVVAQDVVEPEEPDAKPPFAETELALESESASDSENSVQQSLFSPLEDVDQVITTSAECGSGTSCSQTNCAQTAACCKPYGCHRNRVFADYLYLSATDVDMNYALPVNALGSQGTLTGPAAFVSPDYQSGYRIGGGWAINGCSSIVATYWDFASDDSDRTFINPTSPGTTLFLNPVLLDPATFNVAAESSSAQAFYDIDFRMFDLAYERLVSNSCSHAINMVIGARYGQLDQELRANYSILGGTTVESNIDFDGVGPRLGLNGEWLIGSGFFAYGNGFANFLVGNFHADYQQQNTFAGVQSSTSWEDDRIVPLLELELGLGWQTQSGRVRVSSGYYVNSWMNAMTMPEVIGGVQARQLNDVNDNLTFNGLTTRLELRF